MMTNLIKPQGFIDKWIELFNEFDLDDKEHLNTYKNSSLWTNYVLSDQSPVIKGICNEFDLNCRLEEYKIDAVFAQNTRGLVNETLEIKSYGTINEYYPPFYSLLLEHENNWKDCWREMSKLIHFKSPLKVLVTYADYNQDTEKLYNALRTDFKTIIDRSNLVFKENDATHYILILGQRIENQSKLQWLAEHSGNW